MKRLRTTILVMVSVVIVSGPQVIALIQYNNGGTYDITTITNDDIWVDWESPGMQTTVNFLDGGGMGFNFNLITYEDSLVNIDGGQVYRSYIRDGSVITMLSGEITTNLYLLDSSQGNIFGGSIHSSLSIQNNSIAYFDGASVPFLDVSHNGRVNIAGGEISDLLQVSQQGTVTIDGSDFAIDGTLFGYGSLASILGGDSSMEPSRRLTGYLSNGDFLDVNFLIGDTAQIILTPTPEPATILLFGLGTMLLRKNYRYAKGHHYR